MLVENRVSWRPRRGIGLAVAALAGLPAAALGGGAPERTLIVINPASSESMYLGNYYRHARGVPDRNVLYVEPAPGTFAAYCAPNGTAEALLGHLANARIEDHIDVIVVAAGESFWVAAPGLVSDGCSPVNRFSQTSIYTMTHIRQLILAGGNSSQLSNQYFSTGAPQAFSSTTAWLFGSPSTSAAARRYFVCAQLGYTGERGNTVPEILSMIDRSVAADGTRPAATFYFMNTTDPLRNVRSGQFPSAVAAIQSAVPPGSAQTLNGVLPDGQTCAGVMTGWADPDIEGSTMTLAAGSFGDHLTSWAATFDIGAQTKASSWIRKGASGTSGTVEEPCNYPSKFVHANFHNLYYRGMSLGEAWLRSMGYVPFQGLLLGDPLCRPFARIPTVAGNAPGGVQNQPFQFTPAASSPIPGVSILHLDLFVDGVFHSRRGPGEAFTVNPWALRDGPHELRVLATDNSDVRTVGVWAGAFSSGVNGRAVSASVNAASGTLSTLLQVTASAAGGPTELRLLYNDRVVGAAPGGAATLAVRGRNIGAGQGALVVEALYSDGLASRSAAIPVSVSYSAGAPSGQAPVAHGYTKGVMPGTSCPVELPATYDDESATYTVLSGPAHATIGGGTGPYRVVTAGAAACGEDQLTFRVDTASGVSQVATVTLRYRPQYACRADVNNDGALNVADFGAFLTLYAAGDRRTDMDDSCALNVADFGAYLTAYARGCP